MTGQRLRVLQLSHRNAAHDLRAVLHNLRVFHAGGGGGQNHLDSSLFSLQILSTSYTLRKVIFLLWCSGLLLIDDHDYFSLITESGSGSSVLTCSCSVFPSEQSEEERHRPDHSVRGAGPADQRAATGHGGVQEPAGDGQPTQFRYQRNHRNHF